MAENITTGSILETYIKSGLHPKNGVWVGWPKETIVVCKIDFTDNTNEIVIKHNILHGDHAEKVLIEYINSDLDITKIKRITIYTNYSPCIECSVKLQEMKTNVPNFQINFSSLYDIKRPSCAVSGCNCHEKLTKKELSLMQPHEALMKHSERIRRLMDLDARPFEKEDWDALIKLLKENGKQKENDEQKENDKQKVNDEQKKNDTSDLDRLRYGEDYEDWRNREDEKMMADYQMLRAQICQSTPNKNTSMTYEPSGPSKGDQATGSTGDVKPTALDSYLKINKCLVCQLLYPRSTNLCSHVIL